MPEGVSFVGGHPIAGSDRTGIATATADLFSGARCILTPTEKTDKAALKKSPHYGSRSAQQFLLWMQRSMTGYTPP